jgi:hypothetical protein
MKKKIFSYLFTQNCIPAAAGAQSLACPACSRGACFSGDRRSGRKKFFYLFTQNLSSSWKLKGEFTAKMTF